MTSHPIRNLIFRMAFCIAMLASAAMLRADDYQWVRRTYSWRCSGLMRTATVPIFGEDIVIRVSSPTKAVVRVTLFDEQDKVASRRAPEVICENTHLRSSSSSFSGLKKISLLVESSRECLVEIDQYLDTVEEWRLKNWLQKRSTLTPRKLAMWAGDTTQSFLFTPKMPCTRLSFTQRSEGSVELIATAKDGTVLFRRFMNISGQHVNGWLHTSDEVSFSVQAAKGTAWLLELTEE